jgi:hypothetical protein
MCGSEDLLVSDVPALTEPLLELCRRGFSISEAYAIVAKGVAADMLKETMKIVITEAMKQAEKELDE